MSTTLLWLRNDLRLTDNPALEAARHDAHLVPVYIHDLQQYGQWAPGSASRWWLHHSLAALDRDLRRLGSRLVLRRGPVRETLRTLARETQATRIVWNRRHEPDLVSADRHLKAELRSGGLEVRSFNAGLMFEPWEVMRHRDRKEPAPYRVFTAYWKACLHQGLPGPLKTCSDRLPGVPETITGLPLEKLGLLPRVAWDGALRTRWQPGEDGAIARLHAFLEDAVQQYEGLRDHPGVAGTSILSPHLHFGEVGPRQIAQAVLASLEATAGDTAPLQGFVRQLGWREFAHHLLFHFPDTTSRPLNPRFETFPWRDEYGEDLAAWQMGRTGIPLVDAGMRQLWQTGWMHNRVRMVVASFLTKNLLIPWQEGAAWFWDTLVDADLANNTLGWQWVTGCGADAAPYFRIFNPVLQGEKFDPAGGYVRHWVPELAGVPARHIHKPWAAPSGLLTTCGDYPSPIIDLKTSRERALAAYRGL